MHARYGGHLEDIESPQPATGRYTLLHMCADLRQSLVCAHCRCTPIAGVRLLRVQAHGVRIAELKCYNSAETAASFFPLQVYGCVGFRRDARQSIPGRRRASTACDRQMYRYILRADADVCSLHVIPGGRRASTACHRQMYRYILRADADVCSLHVRPGGRRASTACAASPADTDKTGMPPSLH